MSVKEHRWELTLAVERGRQAAPSKCRRWLRRLRSTGGYLVGQRPPSQTSQRRELNPPLGQSESLS
jgi:hypothetical protein